MPTHQRPSTPSIRLASGLLLFSLCNGLAAGGALALTSRWLAANRVLEPSAAGSGPGATWRFLERSQGTDSWVPMWEAASLLQTGRPVYDELFYARKVKFQYPLTSVLPIFGLQRAGVSENAFLIAVNWASWAAVWATIGLSVAIFLGRREQRPDHSRLSPAALAAIAIAGLCFYPVMRGYLLGQVQVILTMLFAAALYAWIRGRETWAGALIGVMVLIKPQFAVFGLWFALRKRRGALTSAACVAVAGAAGAVAVFGWREQLRYLDVLSFIAKRGESYFANLSVNGIVNRLLFNGPNLSWDAHAYAPYHPLVYAATALSSLALLGWALLRPQRGTTSDSTLDFSAMAIVATMASPVAWDHHYGVLFPIFAAMAATAGARRLRMAGFAYVLAANSWSPLNVTASWPVLNVLQSLPLIGVVMLLVLCMNGEPAPAPARDGTVRNARFELVR